MFTMTNQYIVTRVDPNKNIYKIEGPHGQPPYFVNGCLAVGRDLAGSGIPIDSVDISSLPDLERNIITTVRDAAAQLLEKRRTFLSKLNPPS